MAIVGIDLGTTNSAIATMWMGRPEIIPNCYGGRTTPSVVGLTKTGKIAVGVKAKYQRANIVGTPVAEIKRKMGQNTTVALGDRTCTPTQISSYILRILKQDAEQFLQEKIGCAIITIPAYFNESARRATREAGEVAGLHVGMILDEPTASALAYGMQGNREETVMVYDFGGGTLDVSIIEIAGNHFEVLAIDGDALLGGRDFDRLLVDYVNQVLKEKYRWDVNEHPDYLPRLYNAVEAVKCDLSYVRDSAIIMEALTEEIGVCIEMKRELLEELVRPLVKSSILPIQRALHKANLDADEITQILLVGGSTRMPLVRQTVTELFGRQPRTDLNPDECVALGAALYTALLPEETKTQYGMMAGWQGDAGDSLDSNFVVVPRTAHSLGIGVDEGGRTYSVILQVNAFYPVSVTRKDYYTAIANQKGIEFWVYEGENPIALKNMPLGLVRLDLPDGLPAGVPIWITFTLNASRILEVTVALPDRPNVKVQVRIETEGSQSHSAPTAPDIVSLKHQLEKLAKLMETYKEEIPQSRYAEIQWAIQAAEQAITSGNLEDARHKTHMLEHVRDELILLEEHD